MQRRTYASGHGAHGAAKSSDVPWAAGAVIGTVAGLYIVLNQDTSHGESHDDHHGDAHGKEHDDAEEAPVEEESKEEESKDESKDESKEKKSESKKDDSKDEPKEASPDKSDKPDARKEAKSQNETSGKQQGISNDDTHHTAQIAKDEEKSKKGEGVAETAKLKGTVSTDRPGAENKEERGKAQADKDA